MTRLTVQSNSIQSEKLFNQYTTTGTVQSSNILVDKWFKQITCSSKLGNNTKKNPIKYCQISRHMIRNLNLRATLNAQLK